jgi:3-hydroxyisobutyrate dehydrogenase
MTRLMVKDVRLSQAAADATGSPTPLGALALTLYEAAMEAGEGAKDFSVVFRWLAQQKRG